MSLSNAPRSSSSQSGTTDSPSIWSWRGSHATPSARNAGSPESSGQMLNNLHSSALQAAETPRLFQRVMIGSFATLVALALVLMFAPWRQTVAGSGQITAFSPNARPQSVESQIPARIPSWQIDEGDVVAAGDTIATLEDISSGYMDNSFVDRIATSRSNELAVLRIEVQTARQKQLQAQQKLRAAQAKFDNTVAETATARERYRRIEALYRDGLSSLRAFESEQLDLQKARTDSISASADLEAAQQDVEAARLTVRSRQSKLASRRAELDLKLENAQERQAASVVRAPIDGTIARINRAGPGETVKEGGQLAIIVPTTGDQAAELFVNSVDAAIVEPGRRVQLQFSGFPALQFSGFPGTSIGTFSGTVRIIDPVDDGTGRYRLLVVPDTSGSRPAWPDDSYLRQGSSVTGWVLLSNVSLGYEIWRRINGLPPQIPVRSTGTKKSAN
jgi:multidrug resistance efflux pump